MTAIVAIPSVEKYLARSYEMLLAGPKIFVGAFLWQAFAEIGYGNHTPSYYFLTGLGCAIGIILGHMGVGLTIKRNECDPKEEIVKACILAMAAFFGPATTWQYNVNKSVEYGLSFTDAFFYVWFISLLLFFSCITVIRFVYNNYDCYKTRTIKTDSWKQYMWYDLQASFAIGGGDAFFMGTAPEQFSRNWLAGAFGVYDNTPGIEAVFKAGTSTLVGFFIAQVVMNFFIKDSWLDVLPMEAKLPLIRKDVTFTKNTLQNSHEANKVNTSSSGNGSNSVENNVNSESKEQAGENSATPAIGNPMVSDIESSTEANSGASSTSKIVKQTEMNDSSYTTDASSSPTTPASDTVRDSSL